MYEVQEVGWRIKLILNAHISSTGNVGAQGIQFWVGRGGQRRRRTPTTTAATMNAPIAPNQLIAIASQDQMDE